MTEKVIHSFKKSEHEEVRIRLTEFKEKEYFDIRVFYKPDGADDMYPSKKGICLPAAIENIDALIEGLNSVKEKIEE